MLPITVQQLPSALLAEPMEFSFALVVWVRGGLGPLSYGCLGRGLLQVGLVFSFCSCLLRVSDFAAGYGLASGTCLSLFCAVRSAFLAYFLV
ncbi:hypothetical protein U1Q18_024205 [Sarracenia purpurea var. burkii]